MFRVEHPQRSREGFDVEPTQRFQTKKQYVAAWLREQIISGDLPPGTKLRPVELAEQLDVSSTPVREAMLQIESEGLIRNVPHVGAQVVELRAEGIEEMYQLRSLIEGHLAAQASANVDDRAWRDLQKLQAEFVKAHRAKDVAAVRSTNHHLHSRIWELARSPLASEIANMLWLRFPWDAAEGAIPGRTDNSVVEHEQVLLALSSGKPRAAERAMRDHVRAGRLHFEMAFSTDHRRRRGSMPPVKSAG